MGKVKEEIMHSKTRSPSKSKRSTFSRDFSHAEPEPEYSYYKQFSNAFSHAEPEPEPRYRRSPADHHAHGPAGEIFTVDTSLGTEKGSKSILLQRSADIHGFREDLDTIQGQGASVKSSEKKGKVQVVERLVDCWGRTGRGEAQRIKIRTY